MLQAVHFLETTSVDSQLLYKSSLARLTTINGIQYRKEKNCSYKLNYRYSGKLRPSILTQAHSTS